MVEKNGLCNQFEDEYIFHNEIFVDETKSEDQHLISAIFVFDLKCQKDGTVLGFKANLVAQKFMPNYDCGYKETFAPTAKYETLRLTLAIAIQYYWHIHQMDIVAA